MYMIGRTPWLRLNPRCRVQSFSTRPRPHPHTLCFAGKTSSKEVRDRRRSSQPFHGDLVEPYSSLVLDVGANVGYYTLLSASLGNHLIGLKMNSSNLLVATIERLKRGRTRCHISKGCQQRSRSCSSSHGSEEPRLSLYAGDRAIRDDK
jgi:hypothetical protein